MPTLKVWNGSEWEYLTGGAPILQQDAEPGSPVEGDLWIDTDEEAEQSGSTVWADWTPTLTSLTLGSGTVVARYWQDGKLVHFRFKFTLGAGSAVGSDAKFSLPVPAAAIYVPGEPIGMAVLADTGTALRNAHIWWHTGDLGRIMSADTNNALTSLSSTVPHTWASTDIISAFGTYEAA